MSWMDDLTDEQREAIRDVDSRRSHVRTRPAGTKVLRGGKWVEPQGSALSKRRPKPWPSGGGVGRPR